MKTGKTVLYLRTDICDETLRAGGSVAHTLGVIQGFLAHNFTVIIASSIMTELLSQVNAHSLHILVPPAALRWMRWKLNCFFSTFFFLFQTLSFLKKQPNVDFIYQRYSLLNCTGVLLSRLKKIPLVLEYNGSEVWVDTFWAPKKCITFRWLIHLVEGINLQYADTIIVVSQPLKDELLKRGFNGGKIMVNPNGVHTEQFNPAVLASERLALRRQLHLEDHFVFGFIGTFSKWHGIELMATFIPEIIQKNERAAFLLIGDGPLFNYFQQHIDKSMRQRVICTGLIPQHEAKNYLAACDAFLCPTQPNPDGSPFFGSPTKIFEYLSMGKPVVAADIGQLKELIYPAIVLNENKVDGIEIDKQVGIRVAGAQCAAYSAAIEWIMQCSDQERELLGKNARQKAVEHYDWNMHVRTIIDSIEYEKAI